ncbi:hypothetical protein X975_01381, partial [Stegodyphus mimosarum]
MFTKFLSGGIVLKHIEHFQLAAFISNMYWLIAAISLGRGSKLGESMDVIKCIVSVWLDRRLKYCQIVISFEKLKVEKEGWKPLNPLL